MTFEFLKRKRPKKQLKSTIMRREMNINDEVEKTLQALDGVERMEANPYFYTRLNQRIQDEKTETSRPPLIFSKLWQPALLAVLVIFNVYTFVQVDGANGSETAQDGVSVLMQEYQINSSNSSYDYVAIDEN